MTSKVQLKLKKEGYDVIDKDITELPEELGINQLYHLFKQLNDRELYLCLGFSLDGGNLNQVFDNNIRGNINPTLIVSLRNKPAVILNVVDIMWFTKLIIEVGDQLTEENRKNVISIMSLDYKLNISFK